MAKKAPRKIEKKEFDLDAVMAEHGLKTIVKDKPLEWIPLSPAFHEATGIPGIPKGYVTLFRGFSNTGKSTGMYEGVRACQKLGILPVIIDTENNFAWDYAKTIGVEFEEVIDEDTKQIINYKGDFLYVNTTALKEKYGTYDYAEGKWKKENRGKAVLEDVAHLISDLEGLQIAGKLNKELCFFWDSIGSINCFKSVMSKSNNNMWNAGALNSAFNDIINDTIPSSRKEGQKYTNTFFGVQKIWLDSMQGAGVIKHKGGEAFFYGARLIVHLGGITSHGTSRLKATASGNDYFYATKTKIKVEKNQINGIEYSGEIASTPHGYINPDKKNDYTKEYKDFILEKLKVSKDAEIIFTEEKPDSETVKNMLLGEE
jgi:hypothetical protein